MLENPHPSPYDSALHLLLAGVLHLADRGAVIDMKVPIRIVLLPYMLLLLCSCSGVSYTSNEYGPNMRRWSIGRDVSGETISIGGGQDFTYGVEIGTESISFQNAAQAVVAGIALDALRSMVNTGTSAKVTKNADSNTAGVLNNASDNATTLGIEEEITKRQALELLEP